jgi:hypothetical protein
MTAALHFSNAKSVRLKLWPGFALPFEFLKGP